MTTSETLDATEVIERYIILLLGVLNKPIPSILHLQKELFMLSLANPKLKNFLIFEKHYKGPYCQDLQDTIKDPFFYQNSFKKTRDGRLSLTEKGNDIFNDLIQDFEKNKKFKEFIGMMKLTRNLYDKLTKDELLLLIYSSFNKYKENSSESERILSNDYRILLAKSLYRKELISKERYEELVRYG